MHPRILRVFLVVAVTAIVGASAYGGWRWLQARAAATAQAGAAQPLPPARVSVHAVGRMDIPISVEGIGTVQGFNTVTVRSRVDGAIQEVAFREGQTVKTGDVLLRIDPRPYRAALDQAKAKLAQDQAQLANVRLDLARAEQLLARGAASRQQGDTLQAQVNVLLSQLEADRAMIEAAQTQLDYTTIRSPIEGRVGLRNVDIGNLVSAGAATALLVVTQVQPIAVVFTLPEISLPAVSEAMTRGPVAVAVAGRDARVLLGRGTVDSIDNQVDPNTGTIRLKSILPNSDMKLWPGQFVNVRVELEVLHDRLAVPAAAVQRGPNGDFVYVVRADRTVEARPIQVSGQSDNMAVVGQGLQPGESIVVDGAFKLRPGMNVVPIRARSTGPGVPRS